MGNPFSTAKPFSDDNLPTTPLPEPKMATEIIIQGPGVGERKSAGLVGEESIPSISDFDWTEGEQVDFKEIVKVSPSHITPYCLDHVRRRVICVKVEPEELNKKTFLYQEQRQQATKIYAVPYSLFCDVCDELDDSEWESKVYFLHSTGRCGSTLLCKVMGTVSNFVSLSEPDIYSYITLKNALNRGEIDEALMKRLTKASSWMLYFAFCGKHSANPNAKLCVKLRSQNIQIADIMKEAMPTSKSVFLYRDPFDVTDSFCAAFAKGCVMKSVRKLNVDSWFVYSVSKFPLYWDYLCPYMTGAAQNPRFPEDSYRPLGIPGMMAMGWIYVVEKAAELQQQKKVFDVMIRYEDLCQKKIAIVHRMLQECGDDSVDMKEVQLGDVFDEDAHKGNDATTSSRNGAKEFVYISPTDLPLLVTLFGKSTLSPDFIIPGTVQG
eukprot:m.260062 g.260062  ORF g.260062 m.260062 type:complete len:436 (+) comp39110_c0_seq1:97-1404(+)